MSLNILIIGAGPAGSAAAVFLAQAGVRSTLVDRQQIGLAKSNFCKVGESLPPAAKTLLDQLGIWEAFQKAGHLRCYNNRSYWYSEEPAFRDFITQPPGYGWHLDRCVFEHQLVRRAVESGALLRSGTKVRAADYSEIL